MPEFKFFLEGVISTTVEAADEAAARAMLTDGHYTPEIYQVESDGDYADLYEIDGTLPSERLRMEIGEQAQANEPARRAAAEALLQGAAETEETCDGCNGLGWLITERSDGPSAVECCDMCQTFYSDQEAATEANKVGIACSPVYPCVLTDQTPEGVKRSVEIMNNIAHGHVFRAAAYALFRGIPKPERASEARPMMVTCPQCYSTRVRPELGAGEVNYTCLDCYNVFTNGSEK